MSFVKTLATLAIGFAAARGVDKFREAGGMEGLKETLRKSGEPGGASDQMGDMAEKIGLPGGKEAVKNMMSRFSGKAAEATEATEVGMGNLLSAMKGAATQGASGLADMFGGLTSGTSVGNMNEENAKLMIRAMIQAAKADGEIDADERAKILEHLADASKEEMAFVNTELDAKVDPGALAKDVGDNAKVQVYSAALMVITVDTEAERQYLANLSAAMGLEASKVKEIHTAMGKPYM